MTVADRIKSRRKELKMSQTDLATLAGYSDKTSISKLENAGDNITLKQIRRLATALNCSAKYLLGFDNPDPISEGDRHVLFCYHLLNEGERSFIDRTFNNIYAEYQQNKKEGAISAS